MKTYLKMIAWGSFILFCIQMPVLILSEKIKFVEKGAFTFGVIAGMIIINVCYHIDKKSK